MNDFLNANNKNVHFSCKQWMDILKRKSFLPSDRICSDHFSESAFTNAETKRRLKEEALPSIKMVFLYIICK